METVKYQRTENLYEWCKRKHQDAILQECADNPTLILMNSHQKISWKCPLGHAYQTTLRKKIEGYCCPVCRALQSRTQRPPRTSFQDWCQQTEHLEMLEEFTGETETGKNIPASMISYGSGKKLKWRCKQGHEWIKSCNYRVNFQQKCPVCSQKPPKLSFYQWCMDNGKYGQKLLSEFTGITAEGDHIAAEALAFGSSHELLWKCQNGHTWVSKCNARTMTVRSDKSGCPYCYPDHYRYKVWVSLKQWCEVHHNTEILEELNSEIQPDKIAFWDKNVLDWKCKNGHVWSCSCNDRTKGKGFKCPICNGTHITLYTWCRNHGEAGMKVLDSFLGELEDGTPISAEDISYGSTIKCKWRKKDGSIGIMSPNDKTGVRPLPVKTKEQNTFISLQEWCKSHNRQDILDEFQGFSEKMELDVRPENISYSTKRKSLWKCPQGHFYKVSVYARTHQKNNVISCPFCRPPRISLQSWCETHKDGRFLLNEFVGEYANHTVCDASMIAFGSTYSCLWQCSQGHIWEDSPQKRTSTLLACPICRMKSKISTSLKDWCLERGEYGASLLEEYTGELASGGIRKADEISFGSGKMVKWKCKNGHTWIKSVTARTSRSYDVCPVCRKERKKNKNL